MGFFLVIGCGKAMLYKREFYERRYDATQVAAKKIGRLVLQQIGEVHSVVDVGCGVGAWLRTFAEMGVGDVQGVDGSWVDLDLLEISPAQFEEVDLEEPIKLGRRFDLAISLEVAEHVSSTNSNTFVESLSRLSDRVLFSAAIPSQGGVGHINEQPPEYWADLFLAHGYKQFDTLRHQIWRDHEIPFWYRQNVFLYVADSVAETLAINPNAGLNGLHVVHPEKYQDAMKKLGEARKNLRQLEAEQSVGEEHATPPLRPGSRRR